MFDPRLAITFVAVADNLSFTRAAAQLGVAQPWVSEQVRRLEDQLGFRLLDRHSRLVTITSQGARFLAFARALSQANEVAQKFARETSTALNRTLRLGTPEVVTDLPERLELIDRFVEANPLVQLQIHAGAVPDLIARLKRGELDVVMAYQSSVEPSDEMETTLFVGRIAHLMVPANHPLAMLDAVPLSALAGHTMISSPGRSDPAALRHAFAPFVAHGAVVVPAPESHRTTIEHYALIRRQICLRWYPVRMNRFTSDGMVCLPIDDDNLPTIRVAFWRKSGQASNLTRRFCTMGRKLADANNRHAAVSEPTLC